MERKGVQINLKAQPRWVSKTEIAKKKSLSLTGTIAKFSEDKTHT